MKNIDRGLVLGLISLSLYIVGGVSTFGGLGMIAGLKENNISGVGNLASLGYVFVCVGLCVSIAGVLLMRILRNRRMC